MAESKIVLQLELDFELVVQRLLKSLDPSEWEGSVAVPLPPALSTHPERARRSKKDLSYLSCRAAPSTS
jgi:hypothetical protein